MAHFAQLDENNVVQGVIAVHNDVVRNEPFPASEPIGVEFCQSLYGVDTRWAQTSYSASFRYNYAGIGYTFDPVAQAFIAPKPYPSWRLNTNTFQWEPPVSHPNDGNIYSWDEATQSWVMTTTPSE